MQDRRYPPTSGQGRGPAGSTQAPVVRPEELRAVIKDGDAKKLNEIASSLGKTFQEPPRPLSTSQIRGILDHLQRMPGYDPKKVQLLRPKLAYAAGRHGGKVKDLQDVTDKAIMLVDSPDSFENFKSFFEAIVAYHRYHGGRE